VGDRNRLGLCSRSARKIPRSLMVSGGGGSVLTSELARARPELSRRNRTSFQARMVAWAEVDDLLPRRIDFCGFRYECELLRIPSV
jgi:hypothetical protein